MGAALGTVGGLCDLVEDVGQMKGQAEGGGGGGSRPGSWLRRRQSNGQLQKLWQKVQLRTYTCTYVHNRRANYM